MKMNRQAHLMITACAVIVMIGTSTARGDSIRLGIQVASLPLHGGCEVRRVSSRGVGERMGLKIGDVIVRANGRKVTARPDILRELATEHIDLIWRRGAKFYLASAALAVTAPAFERPVAVTMVDAAVEVNESGAPIGTGPGDVGNQPVPPRSDDPGPAARPLRLGVWTRTSHFSNGDATAQVTRVEPGSPSQRLTQVGDASKKTFRVIPHDNYILEVNGIAVHGHEEFQQLIAKSPATCDLRVYNPVTGKDAHYIATLR